MISDSIIKDGLFLEYNKKSELISLQQSFATTNTLPPICLQTMQLLREIPGTNLVSFVDGGQDDLLHATDWSREAIHHPNATGEQEHIHVPTCCYMHASIPPEQQIVGCTVTTRTGKYRTIA
jgi:hypothetical protein